MRGCDGCGRDLRPVVFSPDGDDPKGLGFCFLCMKEAERAEARRCPCGQPKRCESPAVCSYA
jgi:hypothetical protein